MMNLENIKQAKLAYSAMELPTQGHMERQQAISATLLKISFKNSMLQNRYYFTVYLERQITPIAAKKRRMEEN